MFASDLFLFTLLIFCIGFYIPSSGYLKMSLDMFLVDRSRKRLKVIIVEHSSF